MTDHKFADWKRDARSVVLVLAAGAAIAAPTATPLMAGSIDELKGGVVEMLNAPPNHVRAYQDLVGKKLMRSGYGEAALVAAGAEEALHERGEHVSPEHINTSVKLAKIVFEIAMDTGVGNLGALQQLHAQGQQMVETGQINAEQLEAWAGEIVDFSQNGMAEIEAVTEELAAANLEDFQAHTFAYSYMQAYARGDAKVGLAEQADVPQEVLTAADRLENGVVAQMANINAGKNGDFGWMVKPDAQMQPN